MERNFEHKDSNFQNLEGDVSLEKVKGRCSGYNWEIGELLLPKKPLGEFGGYTPQEMSWGGGTQVDRVVLGCHRCYSLVVAFRCGM